MSKKIVINSITKFLNDEVTDVVDESQSVIDINEDSSVIETTIAPSGTYSLSNSYKGMKTLRIISDQPITMSYTSQGSPYNFGARFKEIQLVANGEDADSSTDWIASYGNITLQNADADDTAHIKIIYTY